MGTRPRRNEAVVSAIVALRQLQGQSKWERRIEKERSKQEKDLDSCGGSSHTATSTDHSPWKSTLARDLLLASRGLLLARAVVVGSR